MRVTVSTSYSLEYAPLHHLTYRGKMEYADKWDYRPAAHKHLFPERIAWERPHFWLVELHLSDYIFFTGTDAAITNPGISLESLIDTDPKADFYFAVDHNGLQSDSWIMRNTPAAIRFLEQVIQMEGKEANEQDAMQVILSGSANYADLRRRFDGEGIDREEFFRKELNKSNVRCHILPRQIINAVPHKEYGGTGEEPYSWTPQSLVIHCPGRSLEWRLEHMPKYLTK